MINFDRNICTNFEEASNREWLETNGIGGFASGTISGANTRRYHGLLTAATEPPLGRITMLSKFEETLVVDGKNFELSTNQYPGRIYPEGYRYLQNFRLDPFPVWTFEVEGIEIEKKLFMVHGENTVVIKYSAKLKAQSPKTQVELVLKPLLSFVDYHALQHRNSEVNLKYDTGDNLVSIHPYDKMPPLFFHHNALNVDKTGFWYNDLVYQIERERGFDFIEDLFQPFAMKFDLTDAAIIITSTVQQGGFDESELETAEIERRQTLLQMAGAKEEFTKQLVLAADQFIVARGEGHTVIAGYPWFSDWGRDTMISLGGLTLAVNRPEIAKNILLEFSRHISEGMLPNRFPDAGDEAEYNTVDATLWYFEAVRAYTAKTGDYVFVLESLYEKLAGIVAWHLRGTRYNIYVDTDGLLFAGEEGVQLTWMDAKIGDLVVTPRTGKAVEVQALWYNALRIMADLAERFGDNKDKARYESMADLCKLSFNGVFWNEPEQCLFDVVGNEHRDGSVRPNQIFAVSLPFSMLDIERSRKVLEKIQAELLTPVGLRSLSPSDKNYFGTYKGTPFERDLAYHQGTVWAWLIGPFIDAYRKIHGTGKTSENKVSEILSGFKTYLSEDGVGQISEIFDGDVPHRPRGCFAQAWSVAEILRIGATDC
ncbi:MAG: amylo-alpha-1,6-glucosidase [Acidobacteriota bacterium]|nr:amylo-alpha-1,6-glucosidase [Acidobacteriota bacterium]